MADTSGGEKTLPASPRKREQARRKGNVAKSQDLNAGITLTAALLVLALTGGSILEQLVDMTAYYLGGVASIPLDTSTAAPLTAGVLMRAGRMVVPAMLMMLVAGVAVNLLQVGFLLTGEPLIPKLDKLNIFTGFKKFFNPRTASELVKSVLKLSIIGFVVYLTLKSRWDQVLALGYLSPAWVTKSVASIVFVVWLRIALIMIVLGVFDYGFQWWMREQDLRMTVQEAKEESKELEGDPQIRRRIREVQRRMAYQRMMADVPTADVIVTNPIRYAVALRYDAEGMGAPIMVAKGARIVAAKIRSIAEEHDVPIVEKPELARALYRTLDVGQPVPEKLFRAVAEVLAFVYQIDRRADKVRERLHMFSPAG
ncbi:MAG: flagellar biosynthesis protein FlhB [bacterium]|nr:flagellar biosynthesis protein FlhB [bacterium]